MLAGKEDTMNILFINGSPNEKGNTAKMAAELLKNQTYETLNLVDYRINAYGQDLPGDELDEMCIRDRPYSAEKERRKNTIFINY